MIAFDWADFTAPLSPLVLGVSFLLGLGVGWTAERMGQHLGNDHLFWSLATGVVFFVPLSVVRGMVEDSPIWERFLATLVLWTIFCLGKWVGSVRRR